MNRGLVCLFFILTFLTASIGVSQTVETIAGPNSGITDGLVRDSQGNLYGSDFDGTSVFKVTPIGEVSQFATGFGHPNGMTIDADDNIYLAATWDHAIYRISPDGEVAQYGPYVQNPNGLVFEPDSDTLIITSYALSSVRKLAPDGTLTDYISGGDLNGPLGLAYDDENTLYVSNFNDGMVFRVVDDELVHLGTIPSGPLWGSNYACGFLTYASGALYGTGIAVNIVYQLTLEGELSEFAGTGDAGMADGPADQATFNLPNGITTNSTGDTLYVSDFNTQAVRMITGFASPVNHNREDLPSGFILAQNYPNPFNPSTRINYYLPLQTTVRLVVLNNLGREVVELINKEQPAGSFSTFFEASSLSSGTYYYQLSTESGSLTRPMILLK